MLGQGFEVLPCKLVIKISKNSVTNYKVGGESLCDATPATLTLPTNRRESFQHDIELG